MDLTVRQIQSDLPFENEFRLPVDVEIVGRLGRGRDASRRALGLVDDGRAAGARAGRAA